MMKQHLCIQLEQRRRMVEQWDKGVCTVLKYKPLCVANLYAQKAEVCYKMRPSSEDTASLKQQDRDCSCHS